MRFQLLLLSILFSFCAKAQTIVIKGKVVDAQSGLPIAQSHVFIPRTSIQTFTDSVGHFALTGVNPGRWTLVSAKEGHLSQAQEILARKSIRDDSNVISFALKENPNHRLAQKKNGNTKKNLEKLLAQFVAAGEEENIVLVNPDAVSYDVDKKTKSAIAYVNDALIFKNSTKGYLITIWLNDPFQV
ncbi:MAG: carboxypeptidase-like regulatory domain-containing protein [Algoriphagus sp.]|jgi:hypothetical protein|nr:carboxypeptidase-like regulatory domain-containing protein [Algoriphagus sp.]